MDTTQDEYPDEQEWQWCLVGNIVEEHEFGENHIVKYGTKQFRPNAKVFINLIYGGMGHEQILVIGIPRHSQSYIEIVIPRKHVCNFRMKKVFKPAVLKRINSSDWDWWGNTNSSHNRLIEVLEWLNPEEADKEKSKLVNSDLCNTDKGTIINK